MRTQNGQVVVMNHDHERGIAKVASAELLERDETAGEGIDAYVGRVVGELATVTCVRGRRREYLVLKCRRLLDHTTTAAAASSCQQHR